jgi:O-methyltransferase involved in polyketide biosynthesis
MPSLPRVARAARAFLGAAVTSLATEHGIRQFLDIGSGLPTADNTHEVAQRVAPSSRVVYADHDPAVLRHAEELLTSASPGATDYLQADLRDVDAILAGAARTLDFSQPVAIFLIAVLHFISDADSPHSIVERLMSAVAPGSYLVILHAPSDIRASEISEMSRQYNTNTPSPIIPRSREQVERFFDGLEMVGPGLVNVTEWLNLTDNGLVSHVGIGRKPGRLP